MLQIRCSKCQAVLAFDDSSAGSGVSCPDCDALIAVPAPSNERVAIMKQADVWPKAKKPVEPSEDANLRDPITPEDEEVLAELEQLQEQRPGTA